MATTDLQLNPQQVYSAANVQQTAVAPVTRPDLSDPFKLYDYYFKSPEMTAAQSEIQGLQGSINQANQALRNQVTQIEQQPVAMNLIRGEQARARELGANELTALSENLLAKQSYLDTLRSDTTNRYNIALTERANIQDLIRQTGGKAKIHYGMTYEDALPIATKYLEKKAQKDAVKQLYLQTFGSTGKGKSTKDMEKKLKKEFESERAYKKAMQDLELAYKKKSLAQLGSSSGTAAGVLQSAGTTLQRGEGGYVDYADYLAEKDKAVKSGRVTGLEFDAQYGSMLSPDDINRFGIGLTPVQQQKSSQVSVQQQQRQDSYNKAMEQLALIENASNELGRVSNATLARLGGVGANLSSLTGIGSKDAVQKIRGYQALVGNIALIARQLGHTGVLTEPDVQSVINALPTLYDTKEEATLKMDYVKRIMNAASNKINDPEMDLSDEEAYAAYLKLKGK
jgi:hypothetical protein